MTLKIICSLLICVFLQTYTTFAQITIIDSQNNEAIPAVSVYTSGGKSIATSDINGKISTAIFNNLSNNTSYVSIQHIGYQNVEISVAELKETTLIKMKRSDNVLPDVIVSSSKSNDYVVLKGFFRTYQSFDSMPKYFVDGIVNYYIPLKKGNKVYKEVLQYRVFGNKPLLQKLERKKINLFTESPRVPSMHKATAIDRLSNKNYQIETIATGKNIILLDSIIGFARNIDSNSTLLFIDRLAPAKEKTLKLPGMEMKMLKSQITEIYSTNNHLDVLQKKNLESSKENTLFQYKKKRSQDFYELEFINELFIIGKSFTNSTKFNKNINTSVYIEEGYNYTSEYWKNMNKYNIPPINSNIEKELGNSLTMYEKKVE